MTINCACGLSLMPKFRGTVKVGQTVAVTCRCGRRHTYTATFFDEIAATLDEMQREVQNVTRKAAAEAARK